ncbi:hypothetical protein EI94DRAFT_350981, partial [Lactarius quietus]
MPPPHELMEPLGVPYGPYDVPRHRRRAVPQAVSQSCLLNRKPLLLLPMFMPRPLLLMPMPQLLPRQSFHRRHLRRQDVDARDIPENASIICTHLRPRRPTWNHSARSMRAHHPHHQISTCPIASPKSHRTTRAHRRIFPSLRSWRPWISHARRKESRKRSWSTSMRRRSRYRASRSRWPPPPLLRICSAVVRLMIDGRHVDRLTHVGLSSLRRSVKLSPSHHHHRVRSLTCTITTHRSSKFKILLTMTRDSK